MHFWKCNTARVENLRQKRMFRAPFFFSFEEGEAAPRFQLDLGLWLTPPPPKSLPDPLDNQRNSSPVMKAEEEPDVQCLLCSVAVTHSWQNVEANHGVCFNHFLRHFTNGSNG